MDVHQPDARACVVLVTPSRCGCVYGTKETDSFSRLRDNPGYCNLSKVDLVGEALFRATTAPCILRRGNSTYTSRRAIDDGKGVDDWAENAGSVFLHNFLSPNASVTDMLYFFIVVLAPCKSAEKKWNIAMTRCEVDSGH